MGSNSVRTFDRINANLPIFDSLLKLLRQQKLNYSAFVDYGGWIVPVRLFAAKRRHAKRRKDEKKRHAKKRKDEKTTCEKTTGRHNSKRKDEKTPRLNKKKKKKKDFLLDPFCIILILMSVMYIECSYC